MHKHPLDETWHQQPGLVLGCARLGSALTPLSPADSLALVRQAHELGVRHFDTASIYGQGDSERYIGQALKAVRGEVVISSKAGQLLSAKQALLARFKGPIRWLAGRTPAVRQTVATQRGLGVPRCFEPAYIGHALDQSLKRLGTDHLDVFYLHSPTVQALADPALKASLLAWRASGRFVMLGASCDDLETALMAARDPDIQVVQFAPGVDDTSALILDTIAQTGKTAVVRGLLNQSSGAAGLAGRFKASLAHPAVRAVIVGTTHRGHLVDNVRAFKQAISADQ